MANASGMLKMKHRVGWLVGWGQGLFFRCLYFFWLVAFVGVLSIWDVFFVQFFIGEGI